MKTILITDDDQHVRFLVKELLNKEGFQTVEAANGSEALELMKNESLDLAIIDIMMPYIDGYRLTEEIRKYSEIPIIMLTSKSQLEDKEKGFLLGTDDYLVKPFEPKELLFRINALLRRYGKSEEKNLRLGSLLINKKSYEIELEGKIYILPLKEFELLHFLASQPNQVFSRGQIIEHIWGLDYEGDERTVDVHIKRLRERFTKVSNEFSIKTVRGIGYSLEYRQ
ncbi:response regulator transcription factor [Bacillus sp. ISL-47]|uniref:response regulator transcription factor n=1 Tax=Bacillus sp. ISL-47 TaxID=2819130 RepID=UPI001BE77825|nr:response regulator transcription factor [Bacillus sp. ISL-47]MBT2689986.1 response regulator transcription factor [Bacillus sp. ISL-47]MBT2709353.1 response regulator transcription factor [Pseudomonas sp. ISL-84]